MDWDRIDREGAEALSKDGECFTRMNMKDGEITVCMPASMSKTTFLEQYMDDHGHEVFADLTDQVREIGERFRQEEYRIQTQGMPILTDFSGGPSPVEKMTVEQIAQDYRPLTAAELGGIRQVAQSMPVETHREKMARKKRERATMRPDVVYTPEQLAFEADHKLQAAIRRKRHEINARIRAGERVSIAESLGLR